MKRSMGLSFSFFLFFVFVVQRILKEDSNGTEIKLKMTTLEGFHCRWPSSAPPTCPAVEQGLPAGPWQLLTWETKMRKQDKIKRYRQKMPPFLCFLLGSKTLSSAQLSLNQIPRTHTHTHKLTHTH